MTSAPAMRRPAWAAALLLAACATVPEPASMLSGRLSLQVAASDAAPARGFHAAFDLRGDAVRGRLDLSTPLGPTIAAMQWAPGDVRLRTTEGERRFDSLDALAAEVLGEALPLHALPDWLRGRPWPDAPAVRDGGGFSQLGWRLDLAARGEGVIVATREAPPPRVTLRVRLSEPAS